MTTTDSGSSQNKQRAEHSAAPPDDLGSFDLAALIRFLWGEKVTIIVTTTIFALASIAYALLATQWYRAEVLMAPADEQSPAGLAGQFGGLVDLAGINLGSGNSAEPVAMASSRGFVRDFIAANDLLPIMFAEDWDAERGEWKSSDPEGQPDIRDAVITFRETLLRVRDDPKTGLVTLSVEWKDPVIASEWANMMVDRLNSKMRERALEDAQRNVEFLRDQMQQMTVVPIQQSVGSLLESELQKLMLAKGNEEFAFRIIDSASPPKYRSRPRRTLLVIASTMLGGIVGIFIALFRRKMLPLLKERNTL